MGSHRRGRGCGTTRITCSSCDSFVATARRARFRRVPVYRVSEVADLAARKDVRKVMVYHGRSIEAKMECRVAGEATRGV